MHKILTFAMSLFVPVHDEDHLSDWIGDSKLKDPYTLTECCGIRDCHPVKFGGVLETADGYYVVELEKTVPSYRVIWQSPDGKWWMCMEWLEDEFIGRGMLRCLIGPPRSS